MCLVGVSKWQLLLHHGDGKSITFSTRASSIDPFGDNGSDVFIAKNGVYNLFNKPEDGILTIDGFAEEYLFISIMTMLRSLTQLRSCFKRHIEITVQRQEISVQDIHDT